MRPKRLSINNLPIVSLQVIGSSLTLFLHCHLLRPGSGVREKKEQKYSSDTWKSYNLPQDSVSSVTQLCPTLCDPMDCSTPGLPVHHQLPEFTQTHVHWVGDAIQSSHRLSSPSPPTFNLSQHQGLFKWVSSSQQVVKVLEFQLQHQSFQWIFSTDFL